MKTPTLIVAILFCLLAMGCEEPNVGILSGKVMVDGQPAETGSIAFFPVDGQAVTAGGVIADGEYNARVPLGKSRVVIRVPKVVGEAKLYDVPDSPTQPLLDEMLPARYNNESELEITVEKGPHEHNFETTTK
jgi:hypothetical protein